MRENLHIAIIDLENALQRLHDNDLELIYKFHIFQTCSLDELCKEYGIHSRSGMSLRIHRAVKRLVRIMEGADET